MEDPTPFEFSESEDGEEAPDKAKEEEAGPKWKQIPIPEINIKNENTTLAAISFIITLMNVLNIAASVQDNREGMYDGEGDQYGNLETYLNITIVLLCIFSFTAFFRCVRLMRMDLLNQEMLDQARPL